MIPDHYRMNVRLAVEPRPAFGIARVPASKNVPEDPGAGAIDL